MTTAPMEREVTGANRLSDLARSIFSTVGILPILLAVVILYFASQESRFYGTANLTNVLRQSTYLIIVTLGQALVLISGGFDLSVGAVIAVTSVVSARYMSNYYAANPNSELTSVLVGVGVGLLVGHDLRTRQRHRRRALQGLAVHHDPRHGVGRERLRPLLHRGIASQRHAAPLHAGDRHRALVRDPGSHLRRDCARRSWCSSWSVRRPGDAISMPSAATRKPPFSPASRSGSTPPRSMSCAACWPPLPDCCSPRAPRPANRTSAASTRSNRSRPR